MNTRVGVTYESGSGDYAEWLERTDENEKLTFGDIVGVRGGRITKSTADADHLMVVSMSPIVLGNTPAKGRGKAFEKVAFMGQVPVKVQGAVNIGDYILASGQGNGIGRAVAPAAMTLAQYRQVVGVAWSSAPERGSFSLINVAVGINSNDLALKMMEQQTELTQLRASLNGVMGYLKAKDPAFAGIALPAAPSSTATGQASNATTATATPPALQKMPHVTKASYANLAHMVAADPQLLHATMAKVRAQFQKQGVDLAKLPEVQRLLSDEQYFMATYRKIAEGQ